MKDKNRLTDLELMVMRVLWEHENALTIQEIAGFLKKDKISVQSVTQVMSRLVSKKAVEVSGIVLISNVYARVFAPIVTQQQVLEAEIMHLKKSIFSGKRIGTMGIVAALLNNDEGGIAHEDIKELQRIIEKKKADTR